MDDMKTMKEKKLTQLKAMTLTELLIVLAILGILILLAFPIVTPIFQKAHSKEAQLQLNHLKALEKTYFMEHSKYSNEIKAVGFEQALLVTEGEKGTAHYKIEVAEASSNKFVGRATAITDFDGDGQFNVWEIDNDGPPREVAED